MKLLRRFINWVPPVAGVATIGLVFLACSNIWFSILGGAAAIIITRIWIISEIQNRQPKTDEETRDSLARLAETIDVLTLEVADQNTKK